MTGRVLISLRQHLELSFKHVNLYKFNGDVIFFLAPPTCGILPYFMIVAYRVSPMGLNKMYMYMGAEHLSRIARHSLALE